MKQSEHPKSIQSGDFYSIRVFHGVSAGDTKYLGKGIWKQYTVTGDVQITIDWIKLRCLAAKALLNKSKKSKYLHGAILTKAIEWERKENNDD